MTTGAEPSIRVFLSYAQGDDVALDVIQPFVTSLKHMTFADHGRSLDVFIDRESIGWGDDWRACIRSSIDGATVFMPIVTRLYFDRPACREELLTFYNEAKGLGATSLLLPVVLFGHSYISDDSPDIAARIISERQCRDLKAAWMAGPDSAIWREAIVKLAGELVAAVTAAERILGEANGSIVMPALQDDMDENAPGAAEVQEALESFQDESQRLVGALANVLPSIQTILSNPERLQNLSPSEARGAMLEIATQLRPLGVEFEEVGREFESVVVRTDEIMRGYVRFLRANEMHETLDRERVALQEAESEIAPLAEVEGYLAEFLDSIRPLEVSSAPMRKSVRGFREGGKAVRSGLAVMQGWPGIVDDD